MCQIDFSISATDTDGTVVSGEGRYKPTSSGVWTNFTIPDILNAQTPNILTVDTYDLEVRVLDNLGAFSAWFPVAGGFEIGGACTGISSVTSSQTSAGPCSEFYQLNIVGGAGETVNYNLDFTPDNARDVVGGSIVLNGSGIGSLAVAIGSGQSAQTSGTDQFVFTITNSTNPNNSVSESMTFSGCPV